jgi:hypothetical protein
MMPSSEQNKPIGVDISDLRTIQGLIAENPAAITESMLRWQLRHRFRNGLAQHCFPVGRQILISKTGYEHWLASYAGTIRGEVSRKKQYQSHDHDDDHRSVMDEFRRLLPDAIKYSKKARGDE